MKTGRLIMTLMLAVLLFTACDPVEDNLTKMDKLVTAAESKGDTYSQEDWNAFVKDYQDCRDVIVENSKELNPGDFERLGSLSARFDKVLLSYSMNTIQSSISEGISYANGYLEEMSRDNEKE